MILQLNIKAQDNSFIQKSGDYIQLALPAVALASTYFYQGDDKPHWQFVKAYATSLIVTHTLKRLIKKQRPDASDYMSFPSGHTTSAFAGAGFLQQRYGWKVGIPAYLLASYVGYSRIKSNKHDIWDVMAGASIGVTSNLIFVKKHKQKYPQMGFVKWNNYYILSLNYRF